MSNQLYIENKGKDIQLKRGGGGVDYFKVMTNNTSSFLTICFATFYNCKCEGGGVVVVVVEEVFLNQI